MKRKFIYILCFTFIFLIFRNYQLVLDSTVNAVYLWLYKVFPYLFIMIIVNDFLICTNFSNLFKNPSLYIFIMSLLSGTPSSAYIASNLVKKGCISHSYANTTLLFTYFSNPLFLYTILNSIFRSQFIVIKLIIIHYISNIIIYFMNFKKLDKLQLYTTTAKINIADSIKRSINTTIMVLGTIIFYLVVSNIIIATFNIPFSLSVFLRGILELTQGLNALINSNIVAKEFLAIFFISFGGLSIHTQVKCILDEANLDYSYFLKGRILQCWIAIILLFLSYIFI